MSTPAVHTAECRDLNCDGQCLRDKHAALKERVDRLERVNRSLLSRWKHRRVVAAGLKNRLSAAELERDRLAAELTDVRHLRTQDIENLQRSQRERKLAREALQDLVRDHAPGCDCWHHQALTGEQS